MWRRCLSLSSSSNAHLSLPYYHCLITVLLVLVLSLLILTLSLPLPLPLPWPISARSSKDRQDVVLGVPYRRPCSCRQTAKQLSDTGTRKSTNAVPRPRPRPRDEGRRSVDYLVGQTVCELMDVPLHPVFRPRISSLFARSIDDCTDDTTLHLHSPALHCRWFVVRSFPARGLNVWTRLDNRIVSPLFFVPL